MVLKKRGGCIIKKDEEKTTAQELTLMLQRTKHQYAVVTTCQYLSDAFGIDEW